MARPTRDLPSIAALPQLIPLLTEQIHTVITEWALESAVSDTSDLSTPNDIPNGQPALEPDRIPSTKSSATFDSTPLASRKLYHAQRIIASICGKLTELVSEPSGRIIEVACQYWESRALTIAAERRIPDILESAKGKAIYLREIAQRTGVEEKKLGRIIDSIRGFCR